jgi:hypothetical protein
VPTEDVLFEELINQDMVLQSPPLPSTIEGISNDVLALPLQDASLDLPPSLGNTKRGRGASVKPTKPKQRKISVDPAKGARTVIDGFLAQERAKYTDERLFPERTYAKMDIESVISKFGESLAVLLVTIAAPQRIASLRDIICNARVEKPLRKYVFKDDIVLNERVKIILELDERVIGTQLVRWYHILELFTTCGGLETRSETGFVNNTTATLQSQKKGCLGNPTNMDDAKVAEAMIDQIYPGLHPSTEEYKGKLVVFKKLRQLGKRLHILVTKFGQGVLGLMTPFAFENGTDRGFSDNR